MGKRLFFFCRGPRARAILQRFPGGADGRERHRLYHRATVGRRRRRVALRDVDECSPITIFLTMIDSTPAMIPG